MKYLRNTLILCLFAGLAWLVVRHASAPNPPRPAPASEPPAPPAAASETAPPGDPSPPPPQTATPNSFEAAQEQPAVRHDEESTAHSQPAHRFSNAEVLHSVDYAADADGRSKRVRVVSTDFKYPLLRIEQEIFRNPQTGEEEIERQTEMVADHVMVKLADGATEEDLLRLNDRWGAYIRKKMLMKGLYLVQLADVDVDAVTHAVEAYTKEADIIAYAEPDYIAHAEQLLPNDTRFGDLYGLNNTGQSGGLADADIDAPEAWDLLQGGSVVIGIIDTGVDYLHEDLAANMWVNPGEIAGDEVDNDGNGFIDDVHGWDFYNDDADPMDDHSHGSHVAGTVGAVGNNNIGVVGVNWNAQLMALKFLSAGGSGPVSDGVDAVTYANLMHRDYGVHIRLTSNSWGGGGFVQSLADAIEESRAEDMLFIAAAGNDSADTDLFPHYPSSHTNDNIISVAATDRNDQKAGFSNYGAESVDLAAPGVGTLSTIPGNGYGTKSGTSMATPHVAGVAALLFNFSGDESYADVKEAIFAGVDPLTELDGITVTGGRLNALQALQGLGMRVRFSVPGRNDVVDTPPTAVQVEFTDPYDPATVQSDDLTVNDISADTHTLDGPLSVTFQFTSSPVIAEGTQVVRMAEGAIDQVGGVDAVNAYQATFRYDVLPLQVVATVPPAGSIITLPFTNIELQLNEPYDPGSVDVQDLGLSQGSVVSVSLIDSQRVAYVLDGIVDEGPLIVTLLGERIKDAYGNPGEMYTAEFSMDVATRPFPLPFVRLDPAGSLVYDPNLSAYISPGTDNDEYTLDLDAGQTLSVLVEPQGSLQARVEVRDPGGASLGVATSSMAAAAAVLQVVPISAGGVYTIRVTSENNSEGAYTAEAFLNALLEDERYLGVANDTLATAQPLDASFIQLGGSTGSRAAVLGGTASSLSEPVLGYDFEGGLLDSSWTTYSSDANGRIRVTGEYGTAEGQHALIMDRTPDDAFTLNEATWKVDLSEVSEPVLRFQSALWNDEFQLFLTRFSGHKDMDGIAISDNGQVWEPLWLPDTSWGAGVWQEFTVDLAAVARAGRMQLGGDFFIRLMQYDNFAIPGDGRGYDLLSVEAPVPEEDWYSFALDAGVRVSMTVSSLALGKVELSLHDASGLELAGGAAGSGRTRSSIGKFIAPATATYYAKVQGAGAQAYVLTATRRSAFDIEPNEQASDTADLTDSGVALGAISCPPLLYAYDYRTPAGPILQLDPANASIRAYFSAPPAPFASASRHNLAFDGTHLWYNGGKDTNDLLTVFKIDAESGTVVDQHAFSSIDAQGLGHLGDELFVLTGTNSIEVYDDTTFSLKRTLTPTVSGTLVGLEGDAQRNVLFASSIFQRIYKIDPATGNVLAEHNYSGERHSSEVGIAVACDEVFVAEGFAKEIAVYDAETLASVRRMTLDVPLSIGGLAGLNGGNTLDRYKVRVNSGDALTIETWTPSGEPQASSSFVNSLDPLVELRNPAGSIVASDDNSGGDGKNVLLNHTVSQSGYYTVDITGAGNSQGEYVLRVTGSTATADLTPPTLTCPADTTLINGVDCSAVLPDYTGSAVVSDDVSPAANIVVEQMPEPGTEISSSGTRVLTLTARDEAQNEAVCSFLLDVQLDTSLMLTTPPDIALTCDQPPDPGTAGQATASDICLQEPLVTYVDAISTGACALDVVITRNWTATNGTGASVTSAQTITVQDGAAPVMTTPADVTVACDADTTPSALGFATADDNCDPAPPVTFSDVVNPGVCSNQYSIIRTWRAVDACLNVTTSNQVITVVDTTPPTLVLPADVVLECTDDISPAASGWATANDGCDEAPVVAFEDTVTPGACVGASLITRRWTATDACGNAVSLDQLIVTEDTERPDVTVPPDTTVAADGDARPETTGFPALSDLCDPGPESSYSDNLVTNGATVRIVRTWTGSDACGNYRNEEQIIVLGAPDNVVTATHATAGYRPGETSTVFSTFSYPADRSLNSLLWRVSLSNGWSLVSTSGDGGPEISGNDILFTGGSLTANPISFSYEVGVPTGVTETQHLAAIAKYLLDGMVNDLTTNAQPDPLALPRLFQLVVDSAFGQASPGSGTNLFANGSALTLSITNSPLVNGSTQYIATGWVGSGSVLASGATTSTAINLVSDSSISWQWKTQYWLDITSGANGNVDEPDQWVDDGDSITLTAFADDHYSLAGWSGDTGNATTNGNQLMVTMDRPRAITASFVIDTHTLEIASDYGVPVPGVGISAHAFGSILTNRVSLLDTRNSTQFVNTGWAMTGNDPVSGADTNVTMTLTNNAVLTWQWNTQYWFEATNAVGGTTTGSNGWYDSGGSVTVTAIPLGGFSFDGWTGDLPAGNLNDNPLTLTNDQPRAITAQFAIDTNIIVAMQSGGRYRSPGTAGTVNCRFDYPTNETLAELLWTPALPENWTFSAPTGDGGPVVQDTNIVLTGPFTTNPLTFTYHLNVPGNEPVTNLINGRAAFRLDGMDASLSLDAWPRPLLGRRLHSADYRADTWVIDNDEIFRVLAYWRSPGYYREPLGVDGYATTNSPLPSATTNDGLHSADFDADKWRISGTEASEVLVYWRSGGYAITDGSNDGYQPVVTSGDAHGDSIEKGVPPPPDATQEGPPTYDPFGTVVVTNQFVYSGELWALLWRLNVPKGWSILAVTGDGNPELQNDEILWTSLTLPPSPIEMVYSLQVPLSELGQKIVQADVVYHLAGASDAVTTDPVPAQLDMPPLDSDGDGIPDGWEEYFTGDPTNMLPGADNDGDGMLNLAENKAGTDPENSNSLLRIRQVSLKTDGTLQLLWDSVSNRSYALAASTNANERFLALDTNLVSTAPTNSYPSIPLDESLRFFQIEVEQP